MADATAAVPAHLRPSAQQRKAARRRWDGALAAERESEEGSVRREAAIGEEEEG